GTWVRYAYDGFGRRVYREETYWQNKNQLGTEITHYLWDGLHVLMEFDGKGVSPLAEYYLANGRILARKMFGYHGRKEPGNEELLRTRGGLLYYLYDRLGTVVALADRRGELVTRYYYDVFGQPLAGTFGPYNSYGLTGKEYDSKTGQYYFGARWLNSVAGRWLTQDIYRGIAAFPGTLHRYIYVLNNPGKYIDLWGFKVT
ncbi:MAG: RHS repeat-associated core domain-containing protein, partial [Desulfitobacteriaceae bacterium]|nr:RHS repeat-associated core domain-containing protein [Desulfitobacteriaceae bacterium]